MARITKLITSKIKKMKNSSLATEAAKPASAPKPRNAASSARIAKVRLQPSMTSYPPIGRTRPSVSEARTRARMLTFRVVLDGVPRDQLPGDDNALHFVRALADDQQRGVAVKPL